MTKSDYRKQALAARNRLKDIEVEKNENIVFDKLSKHKAFLEAKTVGLYYPIKGEMDLLSLKQSYPDKRYYLPNVENGQIIYRRFTSEQTLIDGPFGTKEVVKNEESVLDCDLYLIPCVATSDLLRIGYGKGYFDQYLKDKSGYKLGITFPMFKTSGIQKDVHDVLLDEVL